MQYVTAYVAESIIAALQYSLLAGFVPETPNSCSHLPPLAPASTTYPGTYVPWYLWYLWYQVLVFLATIYISNKVFMLTCSQPHKDDTLEGILVQPGICTFSYTWYI